MNHLGNLHYAEGSRKKPKRIGRGQGSGRGGTSTRGHKGAQSRAGYKRKIGFEGGQMPLHRRLPKFGFTNINRKEYLGINLLRLSRLVENGLLEDGKITPDVLYDLGLVAKRRTLVKILGVGELTGKLDITAHAFSASAKEKIEAAGGTVTIAEA
jgi:large subunit ribosomal protein L15